jgi:internalin A
MLPRSSQLFSLKRSVPLSLAAIALNACGGDGPSQVDTPDAVATTITVSATAVTLSALGATEQLSATVLDQSGSVMRGATVAWSSSADVVAAVSATGLVTAVDNGTALITATLGPLLATATVTVAQLPASVEVSPGSLTLGGPGATATVLASVLDAEGALIQGATLAWDSDDDAIASVDGAGLVIAVAPGTANVSVEGTANGGTASQALPVLVNPSLQIETTSLPNGDKLLPYGPAALAAVGGGGGYVWSVVGGNLPAGMIVAENGLISGTPTAAETAVFTIQVVSGDGQVARRALALSINPPPVLLATDLCSEHPANAVATFEDTNLETAVRSALGLTSQDELACALLPGLTVLTAEGAGIASLSGMQNLTGLTLLSLVENAITDIGPVGRLRSLRELRLSQNQITDISAVRGLAELEVLYLRDNAIVDTSPISGLANLSVLNLQYNGLTAIGPWTGLTSLFYLELMGNAISDLTPLTDLPALGQLGLEDNAITDITPLSALSYMTQHLSLQRNSIADISALSGFTELSGIALTGNAVSDLTPLAGLTGLSGLWLGDNSITDVSALEGLTGLDGLQLSNNPDLADIQPLIDNAGLGSGDMVRLDGTMVPCVAVATLAARGPEVVSDCVFLQPGELCIDFGGAAIPDFEDGALRSAVRSALGITPSEDLTCALAASVKDLDASSSGITSAVGIQNLTGLATLNLFDNAVSDLSPLSSLTGLTELSAASNSASDLSPLSTLTNLVHLQMGSNGITDISPLSPLTGLTRLVLGVNSISDLTPLAGMAELAILDIWNNELSDISTLEGLTGLNFLDLRSNAGLSDIQPLIDNAGLTTGDTVWLQDVSASLPCADVATLQGKGVTVSFNACS